MWPDAKQMALLESVDPFNVQGYVRAAGWLPSEKPTPRSGGLSAVRLSI